MDQSISEHCDNSEHDDSTASFAPTWNDDDIANLGPANLQRAKPQRAWERTPASPYTRQRLRVGKVWKRAGPSVLRGANPNIEGSAPKRLKAGASPKKVVKRLCLGPEQSVGLQFERIGSPQKRILTRSRNAPEELVALSEDEESLTGCEDDGGEEDVGGTLVEILDEDGNALEPDADDQQAEDWSDLEASADEEPFDDTMMHMDEAIAHEALEFVHVSTELHDGQIMETPQKADSPIQQVGETTLSGDGPEPEEQQRIPVVASLEAPRLLPAESSALPEGFVSPVKRRRTVSKRLNMAAAGRRRTLPRTFAPDVEAEDPATSSVESQPVTQPALVTAPVESAEEQAAFAPAETEQMAVDDEAGDAQDNTEVHDHNKAQDDDVWEDLPEEALEDETKDDDMPAVEDFKATDETASAAIANQEPTYDSLTDSLCPKAHTESTNGLQAAASPLQYQALPLRRSPRRKSSSPRKQPSFATFTDLPHIVAFSPVKRGQLQQPMAMDVFADATTSTEILPNEGAPIDGALLQSPQPLELERSVSAPPEEPQMSPRRSARPRMSDDTALLQAFIARNAFSKSSRRVSASEQEQITNRRDSDTVRQALASPAKVEVLGDLDPNSPSPRKTLDPTPPQDLAASISSPTSTITDDAAAPKARRSGRDRRRADRGMLGAPNKISLRGNNDPVVLKARNEAQELSNLTRQNTRKNKGGSVLPLLRLTKLAAEKAPIEASPPSDATIEIPAKSVKRNIRWDETLAYYQEAPSEPESMLFELGDGGTAKVQGDEQSMAMDVSEDSDSKIVAIPAAETPSKPKIRRLKAPRTAANATPGKPSAAPIPADDAKDDAPAPAPRAKPARRSRIATPAKGLGAASLLPADLAPAPTALAQAKPTPVPRKKALPSRLPAPASFSAPQSQPQQQQATEPAPSLISSPPKKRAPPTTLSFAPGSKSSAPKLDFGRSASFKPAEAESGNNLPGLASPAKKGTRSFFAGSVGGGQENGGGDVMGEEARRKVPGLGSPAKKRTRRAM